MKTLLERLGAGFTDNIKFIGWDPLDQNFNRLMNNCNKIQDISERILYLEEFKLNFQKLPSEYALLLPDSGLIEKIDREINFLEKKMYLNTLKSNPNQLSTQSGNTNIINHENIVEVQYSKFKYYLIYKRIVELKKYNSNLTESVKIAVNEFKGKHPELDKLFTLKNNIFEEVAEHIRRLFYSSKFYEL